MKQRAFLSCIVGVTLACTAIASAQDQPASKGLIPPSATAVGTPGGDLDSETHPTLNLTPDKSQLVHLDRDAASVVVGNPEYARVLIDNPRLAVVIPRKSGATYFTVLDKDGNVIMQRHVIVAAPKKNYVRVRRSCINAAEGKACQPTSVYFCPDMCHEVGAAGGGDEGSPSVPATTAE